MLSAIHAYRQSLVALVVLAIIPISAAAAGPVQRGSDAADFKAFCHSWMSKLEQREQRNLRNAEHRRTGDAVVIEYTGYSKKPDQCEAKASGVPANPYVGKLVYHELRYRKAGYSRDQALSIEPRILQAIEVMEIFRYDGKDWVY